MFNTFNVISQELGLFLYFTWKVKKHVFKLKLKYKSINHWIWVSNIWHPKTGCGIPVKNIT